MSYEGVYSAVRAVVPCVHMAWPEGSAPALPWAVFYLDGTEPVGDDGGYAAREDWVVELYQRARDGGLESALEESLRGSFGAFTKSETWSSDERCLMTAYYFTDFEEV